MPFFARRKQKQSKHGQEQMQKKLFLARHAPDNVFDISDCDLHAIPAESYSLFSVLLKQILIVRGNQLVDFVDSEGGASSFAKLSLAKVIDASENKLRSLPRQIGSFRQLEELNLEHNRLTELPDEICQLKRLQILNVADNQLHELPEQLGDCISLTSLNLAGNPLKRLPNSIVKLRGTLKNLDLENTKLLHPDAATMAGGTESVLRCLCTEQGLDYDEIPADGGLMQLLSPEDATDTSRSDKGMRERSSSNAAFEQMIARLEDDKRRHSVAHAEHERQQTHSLHKQLLNNNQEHKKNLLEKLARDQRLVDEQIQSLAERRDRERKQLLHDIASMEQHATSLITKIIAASSSADRAVRCAEEEEERRIREENWFTSQWIEYERLKRGETERAMACILADNYTLEQLRAQYAMSRGNTINQAIELEQQTADLIDSALKERDLVTAGLCDQILTDQQMQKDALLQLMEQKDSRSNRLNCQIELLQNELASLSMLERDHKTLRQANEHVVLETQRKDLLQLLMQLMGERDKRTKQLQRRLVEMEAAREDERKDFWLVQYQKLMSTKPVSLIEEEGAFDIDLIKVLNRAGAGDFAVCLARHGVNNLTLLAEYDDDTKLARLGIHSITCRKQLLDEIRRYRESHQFEPGAKKKYSIGKKSKLDREEEWESLPVPSTSATGDDSPTAPPLPPHVSARFELECVVCMEAQVCMLFIPCGHVCCCAACAQPLEICPLCRGPLEHKVDLDNTSPPPPTAPSTPTV